MLMGKQRAATKLYRVISLNVWLMGWLVPAVVKGVKKNG
jgi:hypothetical protein